MARFPGHPDHDPAAPTQAGSTRTRRRWVPRVALLAAVALGVVALLVGVGTLTGPAPEPGAGASGGPSPADPPAPDTESPAASGPARTDSALYRVSWEAGAVDCPDTPRPAPPLPNPELADHLREIVDCLVGTHRPMLESVGLTLTVPAVATFSTDVHTPCGVVAARDFPAFYCSGNETIYVRLDSDEDPNGYARSAMGYWIVMSHEFG
ncbi:MAG: hypothetical protein GXX86_13270, partial [Propionibacterium sp.]|nr:hypothetical protein [Propionibacterium sp.]